MWCVDVDVEFVFKKLTSRTTQLSFGAFIILRQKGHEYQTNGYSQNGQVGSNSIDKKHCIPFKTNGKIQV